MASGSAQGHSETAAKLIDAGAQLDLQDVVRASGGSCSSYCCLLCVCVCVWCVCMCLSICLFVCLFVCLSVCLPASLSVFCVPLFVCLWLSLCVCPGLSVYMCGYVCVFRSLSLSPYSYIYIYICIPMPHPPSFHLQKKGRADPPDPIQYCNSLTGSEICQSMNTHRLVQICIQRCVKVLYCLCYSTWLSLAFPQDSKDRTEIFCTS